MKYCFLILCILYSLCFTTQKALSQNKPDWVKGYFNEIENSYIEVVNAEAYNLETAKEKAIQEIITRRSLTTGTSAKVSINEGNIEVSDHHELIICARILDEWSEISPQNLVKVYLLVQTAKNPTYTMEPVKVSEKYPFSWKIFIPGLAQIDKGSKLKGGLIMGGTVATIGGIIVTDCVRSDYVRKISKTKSVEIKRAYATKADHYAMGRNVCIGALAALYIYNIIDAAVAPGARRVVVKDRKDRRYSFLPSITDDGGPALSAFMRF